jgi:hypothetical protein
MRWYKLLFCDNKRAPAPTDFQAAIKFVMQIKEIIGSNNFEIKEITKFLDSILGFYTKGGKEVVVTNDQIYVAGQPNQKPAAKFRIGFTPVMNVPIAVWLENEHVKVLNLESKKPVNCDIQGQHLMAYDGRIYIQGKDDIFELTFIENGTTIIVSVTSVAHIMPNATEMFQGVAFQDMFGAKQVSIFPESGHHRMFKINELSKAKIIDAKFEKNVLMVIGHDQEFGQYNRHIFRFSKNWDGYDVRSIDNISPNGLNFTVLDTGVCICLTEEEKIEIFSGQKDSANVKSITDPAIKADMHLCHSGPQVRFAYGNKLYSFSVKK